MSTDTARPMDSYSLPQTRSRAKTQGNNVSEVICELRGGTRNEAVGREKGYVEKMGSNRLLTPTE